MNPATPLTTAATPGFSGLSVLWFLLVLALVPLVLWGLKRSGLITGLPASRRGEAKGLRLVDVLALAPGQRLMRVELRRPDGSLHHLLLGQSSAGVTLLQQYAVDGAPLTPSADPVDFQQALAQARPGAPS
ncbi:flagellar biosynthetic protein FliO [Amphibiibacter pelophylacis]|uniref:Flagellar biosynthetic protein FliO n=1 Tax=Amphibiibacter pelophylacis TaxID=1799477 RepID=A0ACC6P2Z7_9BURK